MRLDPRGRGARVSAFVGALTLALLLNPVAPWIVAKASAQQDPIPYQTVTTRARPDYDAIGGRLGGFIIFPSIDVAELYDDNIFRTEFIEVSDFITSIRPEVRVKSQWSNHELNFDAGADARRYADENDEDTTDYFIRADGRIDVRRSTKLIGGARYQHLHEDRGDPNSSGAAKEPVEYDLVRANVDAGHKFNRLSVNVTGNLRDYQYENAVNRFTGAIIVEDDRNRQEYEVGLRVGYEIQSEFEAFARGILNYIDYDRLQDGFDRESDGYEVVVGTDFDFGGLLFGEVFAGYSSRDYEDPRLLTNEGPIIGGSVFWNVTELTTVNPFISRTLEETTTASSSGYFATTVGVTVDHELLRNLLLNGEISYENDSYEGSAVGVQERDEDYINFGLGATYLINRYSRASLRYDFERLESNIVGNDYDNNIVRLNIRAQF